MKKLINQIMKFGVVGVIAFVIDFTITMVLSLKLRTPCMDYFASEKPALYIASFVGFTVSLVFNYVASMTFVFKRREGRSRKSEFLQFTVLSIIGLGINECVLYASMYSIGKIVPDIREIFDGQLAEGFSKIVATAVVMVYNFVTRKIFLEDHGSPGPDAEAKTDKSND